MKINKKEYKRDNNSFIQFCHKVEYVRSRVLT
jgi:hypothetical protein